MSILLQTESQRTAQANAIMVAVINYVCVISKAEWRDEMENPFENLEFAQSCFCSNSQEISTKYRGVINSAVLYNLSTFFLFISNIDPSWLTEETKS